MLPEGWRSTTIGKHTDLLTGFPFKSDRYTAEERAIRLIRGDNVVQGRIRWDDVKRWPEEVGPGLERYLLKPGDVLLAMDRTWVKAGLKCAMLINADVPSLLVQRVARLRGDDLLDVRYLYLLLQTHGFSEYVKEVQTETAIPHISAQQIRDFAIIFPAANEQVDIVRTISDWGTAIEQIDRLIKVKRLLKKWLVQQLLSGKLVLPDFQRQERTEFHLGDLFEERREIGRDDLPLHSITATRGLIPQDVLDKKDTSATNKSKYKRIVPGDIGYNTMRMWQGVSVLSTIEGIVSPAYTICIPGPKIDGRFAKHLFKYPPMVRTFWRYSQGLVDDTLSLKYHNFALIKVKLPQVDEQRYIADVLDTADREIDILTRQADALTRQKKALMQKLLTGQIRVKV